MFKSCSSLIFKVFQDCAADMACLLKSCGIECDYLSRLFCKCDMFVEVQYREFIVCCFQCWEFIVCCFSVENSSCAAVAAATLWNYRVLLQHCGLLCVAAALWIIVLLQHCEFIVRCLFSIVNSSCVALVLWIHHVLLQLLQHCEIIVCCCSIVSCCVLLQHCGLLCVAAACSSCAAVALWIHRVLLQHCEFAVCFGVVNSSCVKHMWMLWAFAIAIMVIVNMCAGVARNGIGEVREIRATSGNIASAGALCAKFSVLFGVSLSECGCSFVHFWIAHFRPTMLITHVDCAFQCLTCSDTILLLLQLQNVGGSKATITRKFHSLACSCA